MAEYTRVLVPHDIQMVFQHHAILRQRAGLVGAEHVHGSEILDGIQVLDDGFFPAHGDGALGKAGRDDHGQHFRGKPYGNGNTEQKGLNPVALCKTVDDEHKGHHDQHEVNQHPGYRVDAPGKAGFHRFAGHSGSHGPEQGAVAHGNDDAGGTAGNDAAAHKNDIGVLRDGLRLLFNRMGRLFHRLALARQAGLTDEQILGGKYPHVSRNHIPGGKMHDIPHDHLVQGNLLTVPPLAGHGTGSGNHGQQPFRRTAAAGFLHKTQHAGNEDHGQDDDHGKTVKILHAAAEQPEPGKQHVRTAGHQNKAKENGRKRVDERPRQPLRKRFLLLPRHCIPAESKTAGRYIFFRKAARSAVMAFEHFHCRMCGRIPDTPVPLIAQCSFFSGQIPVPNAAGVPVHCLTSCLVERKQESCSREKRKTPLHDEQNVLHQGGHKPSSGSIDIASFRICGGASPCQTPHAL